jgi:hypothetical protein
MYSKNADCSNFLLVFSYIRNKISNQNQQLTRAYFSYVRVYAPPRQFIFLTAYFYPVGREAEKGKAINLFSKLLISSGKVHSSLNFLARWKSSQERQGNRWHKYGTEPKGTGVCFMHHSARTLISDCILPGSILGRQATKDKKEEHINENNRQLLFAMFFLYFSIYSQRWRAHDAR